MDRLCGKTLKISGPILGDGYIMFGIGIGHLVLARFMQIRKASRILPFATSVVLGSLVLIDGSLGSSMQLAGTATCVLAALLAIVFASHDLKNQSEQSPAGDVLKAAPDE
jgi:hypothetical protein